MAYIKKTKGGYAYGGQVISESDLKKFAFGGSVGENPLLNDASGLSQEKQFGRGWNMAFNMKPMGEGVGNMSPSFKDGGQIEGPGTGKSDSITAKIKGGSFVVPEENAEEAKELRKKVLKAPSSKKANLNQKGGEKVKLSNGEHLFSPEEVEELKEHGYDLSALAPHSEESEEMKKGGLTSSKAKEILRDGTAQGHPLTPAQKRYFGWVAGGRKMDGGMVGYADGVEIDPEKEKAKLEAEKKKELSQRDKAYEDKKLRETITKNILKRETERKGLISEINRLNSGLKQLNDEYSQSTEGLLGYSPERERARKEGVLKKISDLQSELKDKSKRYNFVKDDKNYSQTGEEMARKAPSAKKAELPTKTGAEIEAATKEQGYIKPETTTSQYRPTGKPSVLGKSLKFTPPKPTDEEMAATAPETKVTTPQTAEESKLVQSAQAAETPATTTSPKTGKRLSTGQVSDLIGRGVNLGTGLLNYYLPYKQMQMGKEYLAQAGARPVGHIDPEFNASVNRAQAAAKYGYTPEEQAAIDQQNLASLESQRNAARNYSGGSAGSAYNMERQAAGDYFGRGLQAKIGSRNLQLQKQTYADQMTADKAAMNRQLFEDTLQAWKENQKAGGALLGAGISNMIGANRYNSEISAMRQAGNIENSFLSNLPTQ